MFIAEMMKKVGDNISHLLLIRKHIIIDHIGIDRTGISSLISKGLCQV